MGLLESDARPESQETVSWVSKRSVMLLQLSSMPLPTTSIAPGFTSSGFEPQTPGLSQQSPSDWSQPSSSQSTMVLSQAMHVPATQVPPLQPLPQPPQCAGSVWVSTHRLPHSVRPGAHIVEQEPFEQASPGGHVTPQPPQFSGSVPVSTHSLPHFTEP